MARVAFAAGALLAAMTGFALAQGPSYESRGYGGPLYVGPNFKQGGQYETPTYEKKRTYKKRNKKKRTYRAKKPVPSKAKKADTAKAATPTKRAEKIESENSTITRASSVPPASTGTSAVVAQGEENTKPQGKKAPTKIDCKKYVATIGTTITVPCD